MRMRITLDRGDLCEIHHADAVHIEVNGLGLTVNYDHDRRVLVASALPGSTRPLILEPPPEPEPAEP